jgi:hypothetical protein
VNESALDRWLLGSQYNLDDYCVRVGNVPENLGLDELHYFFNDFQLQPHGIERLPFE